MWLEVLVLSQLFCSCFMAGLIWLVQWVHYPAFHFIDESKSAVFHQFHSRRITWIVAPVMGLELLTAFDLSLSGGVLFIGNLISVMLLWTITLFVSVPLHNHLSTKWESSKVQQLVKTNWLRTGVWTLRSLFWIVYVFLIFTKEFING